MLFLVHLAGSAGHVCMSYRADTCMTRQSATRTSQVFFLFFSHGKMASLTVQDVEVRAPKMICRKGIVLLQGSFYPKGSFVRCQASVDVLALTCYLTVLTSSAMNCLFFRIG